jgi:hypothetical protein
MTQWSLGMRWKKTGCRARGTHARLVVVTGAAEVVGGDADDGRALVVVSIGAELVVSTGSLLVSGAAELVVSGVALVIVVDDGVCDVVSGCWADETAGSGVELGTAADELGAGSTSAADDDEVGSGSAVELVVGSEGELVAGSAEVESDGTAEDALVRTSRGAERSASTLRREIRAGGALDPARLTALSTKLLGNDGEAGAKSSSLSAL